MQPRKMMGFEDPGAQRVPVPVRAWNAMKLGLWRSKTALEIAARAAQEIVERCEHVEGCPGAHNMSAQCTADRYASIETPSGDSLPSAPQLVSRGCPDRETRMSALVILGAARMFAPIDARQLAREPYFAPSREFFSEVMSELAAAQIENEALRAALRAAGMDVPPPPSNEPPNALPSRSASAQLKE